MSKDNRPIGIFDSGIGGLTVANAIKILMPNESIVYFGDTAHLPYGDKSADAIRYFSLRIAKFFIEQNCKMVVIACNSASSTSYETLLDFYKDELIFINVIDPLVQTVLSEDVKKIGVIATKATIASNVYPRKLKAKNPMLEVQQLATPLLAPMIEEGFHNNDVSQSIIQNYLKQTELANIEALLLACTHYPLIREEIKSYLPSEVLVLDPNTSCAEQVLDTLQKFDIENDGEYPKEDAFYVSDLTASFIETTQLFYNKKVALNEALIWK